MGRSRDDEPDVLDYGRPARQSWWRRELSPWQVAVAYTVAVLIFPFSCIAFSLLYNWMFRPSK